MKIKLSGTQFENILTEMAYPSSFNMDEFKNIRTYSGRVSYCEKNLRKIAAGSARIAYQIDESKVLKLAKNPKGLAQNENEMRFGYNNYYFSCIAEVFDGDEDNYTFIEMELARKCTPNDFKNIVGYSLEEVMIYVKNSLAGDNRYPYLKKTDMTQDEIERMNDNEFVSSLNEFVESFSMIVGDMDRISSYGIVKRNGVDDVVLIDYGTDIETYKTHYTKGLRENNDTLPTT